MATKFYGDRSRVVSAPQKSLAEIADERADNFDSYLREYMLDHAGGEYDQGFPGVSSEDETRIRAQTGMDMFVGMPEVALTLGTAVAADIPAGWAGMMVAGDNAKRGGPDIDALLAHSKRNVEAGHTFTDEGGTHSTLSMSVNDERLNPGRETLIPTVYEGRRVDREEAIQRAVASGINWPTFDTPEQATEASIRASGQMGQRDISAVDAIEAVQEKLTYMPRSESGQRVMQMFGNAAEAVMDFIRPVGEVYESGANAIDPSGNMAEGSTLSPESFNAGMMAQMDAVNATGSAEAGTQAGEFIADNVNQGGIIPPRLTGRYPPGHPPIMTKEDINIAGRNVAGIFAGLPADILQMLGSLPLAAPGAFPINVATNTPADFDFPENMPFTSEKLATQFGGDPSHPSFLPAALVTPGPGELKTLAASLKTISSGIPLIAVTIPKAKAAKAKAAKAKAAKVKAAKVKAAEAKAAEAKAAEAKAAEAKAAERLVSATRDEKFKAVDYVEIKPGVRNQQKFNQKLSEARQAMDETSAIQVNAELPKDFKGKIYLTDDGASGFTVSDKGYVANLFKHPDAPPGAMGAALTKARAAGAKNLQAFDAFIVDGHVGKNLVEGYKKRGAVETGRSPWNPRYKPEGWTPEMGTPDYVDMDIGGFLKEQKHATQIKPREQHGLERWRGKGEPPSVVKNFTAEREAGLRQAIERGLEIDGDKWYWLGGLLDEFILEFGPKIGLKRFDKFMDFNTGMSAKSKVNAQIKRASILYQRHIKGQPLNLAQPPGSVANPTGAIKPYFPKGAGHLAHDTHMNALNSYQKQGDVWSPILQPKYSGYSENLKGNYDTSAIDTHYNLLMTGGKVRIGGKSPGYAALENRSAGISREYGLQAGEGQAAGWTGGSDLGLINVDAASRRNMTPQMNQRIAKTAEVLGIPEQEALIRFMHGDTRLYSVMGAIFLGGAVASQGVGSNSLNDNAT